MNEINHVEWWTLLAVALAFFVGSIIWAWFRFKSKYKRGRVIDPLKILFIGVILSALLLFIPIYRVDLASTACSGFEVLLVSIHNVIRLFIVDGDFNFITDVLAVAEGMNGGALPFYSSYTAFFAILFVWAPILTFTFVLSFFKNVLSYIHYFLHFRAEVFVFTGLNEKSISLVESLYKKSKRRVFVFANVKSDETTKELIGRAESLHALCFDKDILDINLTLLKKNNTIRLFAIGDNQAENVEVALMLLKKYKTRSDTHLYVVSDSVETEMMLSRAFETTGGKANIKVRMVNEVQSLILRNLYENGYEKIFKSAYDDGSGVLKINAVVVGMGKQGTEMTKALSWFCQMHGYLVTINSFDINERAGEAFTSECSELMAMSGNDIPYEAKYTINIHSGIDVRAASFDDVLLSLPRTTYAFVALGSDERNVAAAVKLRKLFEREGYAPVIQAVVNNSDKKASLTGVTNYRGEPYDIDFIGDLQTAYSEEVILGTDVEHRARDRHMVDGVAL